MGYYTNYELEYRFLAHEDRFSSVFEEELAKDEKWEIIKEVAKGYGDSIKWYRHDEDMRALSTKYPMILFTLSGKGEESGDIWKKYYCAGKCQVARAQIEYEPFDPDKLS